jgi:small subunit ribosomal protein S21
MIRPKGLQFFGIMTHDQPHPGEKSATFRDHARPLSTAPSDSAISRRNSRWKPPRGHRAIGPAFLILNRKTGLPVQVLVRDNNVDQALRALKKKMQREGIFREMKMRGHYEKPSEKRAREKAEAVRRARKLARKRAQREGLLPMTPRPVAAAGAGAPRPPR